ncbi:leucine--tRNA ligase [Candidatus Peregrinibacteria bacterium CG10_big_fil_rev_8_21_14_0_10_55_24]|nr:MAG: leucine--tRNA ligase [Candidatus Peregrinibacteria bacterium CG10_big_fil_rev_8_21_14_0_10_55_24]
MSKEYNPGVIEAKWQKAWEKKSLFSADLKRSKDPYYALVMFPYPSGAKLHVGHWFAYGPPDTHARFMRMRGKDVFEPIGFDAFGLPAENFAIKTGTPPEASTEENVQTMVKQLKRMGCMYDWDKLVMTSRPEYYRWTQWLFLKMYEKGLAYRKEAPVNYCPSCQTVLANEQAQDGTCERCSTTVIQKPLTQWFWKITQYADALLEGLDDLDWPEKTKTMQRNWIGRSEGAEIHFALDGHKETLTVFTTRPDTLFGATYMVLAPEHPLVEKITPKDHWGAVEAYREAVAKKTELERTDLNKTKTGVPTGAHAINPATKERIPIWIADYVLLSYGTGAIMAVPAHDERDFSFAQTFQLPMVTVVAPDKEGEPTEGVYAEEGVNVHSGFLDGLKTPEAKKRMIAWLEDEGLGQAKTQYRLRDWLVSRQRYWGAPIPIVYDPQGKPHPIPEEHLPWMLPTDVSFKPTGKSPLTQSQELLERVEKIFGKGWIPEYDTMDTFVCSSFYYLRYLAQDDDERLVDPTTEKTWMPVDMYIGGAEHACMHLIYARFVMRALKDFGIVGHEEPFDRLFHQGTITNQGAKMSKSKGNVVSPDAFVERYGSDVFRMYLMFMGPYSEGGDWSDTGIKGIDRFVQRAYTLLTTKVNKKIVQKEELTAALHRTIKRVTEDIGRFHFNTAIAALMELLNLLEKEDGIALETARTFALLLGPLAPHLSEELWSQLGGKGFVMEQHWPSFDPALTTLSTVKIAVQVNGKVRAELTISADSPSQEVIAQAKELENVAKYLSGKEVVKEVYVPGRLINFVV